MKDICEEYVKIKRIVLEEIKDALDHIEPEETEKLLNDVLEAENVFVIGVGRVMMSLQAFVKRISQLGIKAHCVGDVTEPAITERDILIVASGSGESIIPVTIARKAKELGCKRIIHIGSNQKGKMSEYADYMVRIPARTRLYMHDEVKSKQIMTSLFEQSLLIYGDILAMMIVKSKGIDLDELWSFHANLE